MPAHIHPDQGEEVRALDNETENVTVDAPSVKRSCTEVDVSEIPFTPVRTCDGSVRHTVGRPPLLGESIVTENGTGPAMRRISAYMCNGTDP
ncbi:hypothetical protein VTO73DRAFT_6945 [Trametes versicolor]